jgi:uncharacterized protein (TIGR03118 family)
MRHVSPLVTGQGTGGRSLGRCRRWLPGVTASVAAAGLVAATAPAMASATRQADVFSKVNLISNLASPHTSLTDPNLKNAWGITAGPTTPIWVSDNNSGKATVYSGGINGSKVMLDLTVPVPGGNPTGQVFNSTKGFPVGGAGGPAAIFIVDTDSTGSTQSPGQIEAWDGGAKFVVEDSSAGGPGGTIPKGAIFKGLAIANTKAGPELFASDVANGTVDIFNSKFAPVSAPSEFKDPHLPAGYVPFGIQALGGKIYVSYGKQNAQKTDVVPGAGLGVVDVYSVNGALLHHLVSNGPASPLNEPWGLAIAPAGFGPFAGDLLVGNLGNGWINAFNPTTGKFLGVLDNRTGYPITINGLWGLMVGNSAFGGSSSLVFSAGPSGYNNGLVGVIKPG